jgi:hypothetical protein
MFSAGRKAVYTIGKRMAFGVQIHLFFVRPRLRPFLSLSLVIYYVGVIKTPTA